VGGVVSRTPSHRIPMVAATGNADAPCAAADRALSALFRNGEAEVAEHSLS